MTSVGPKGVPGKGRGWEESARGSDDSWTPESMRREAGKIWATPPTPVVGPKLAFFLPPPCQGRGLVGAEPGTKLLPQVTHCSRPGWLQGKGLSPAAQVPLVEAWRTAGMPSGLSTPLRGPPFPCFMSPQPLTHALPSQPRAARVCHQLPCTSACPPPALGLSPGPSCIRPSSSKRQTPTFIAGYSQKPKMEAAQGPISG